MLLYNATSEEWRSIGTGIAGNAIQALAIHEDEIFACGPGIYSYENPGKSFNGVARLSRVDVVTS